MTSRKVLWVAVLITFVMGLALVSGLNKAYAAVTQGEYAVNLAESLGLGKGLSEDAAISALSSKGIVPGGGWNRNEAVTLGFLREIGDKVISAAQGGLINISVQDAVNKLDSLAEKYLSPSELLQYKQYLQSQYPQPVGAGPGGGGEASPSK